MLGFAMQYLARTRSFKKPPKLKKKSSDKLLPRKRKLQEQTQNNGIDEQEEKLPEFVAAQEENGNKNIEEFEKNGKEFEENENENIQGFEKPSRQNPNKKKKGEQVTEHEGNAVEFTEIEPDSEVLPEFVVYDEIPAENVDADGSEAMSNSWAMDEQNELAGIKRMCLPLSKLAPDDSVIPDDWHAAAKFITGNQQPRQSGPGDRFAAPPVVVVCGAQNVGKTTFARFLSNILLIRYKKVGYLDTDVGQPEFTPPGCLSLHILDKPNPDLLTLCLRTPERCYFYGDISPKSDPESFLHIIVNLYDHFRKEYYDTETSDKSSSLKRVQIPLVVNTHGWVKGLGYDVLVDMLRYMVPTHVVQIRMSAVNKNLPLGTFWSSDSDYENPTKLVYLGTAMKDITNKSIVIQKHGRQMRELRIIAYFRQCFGRSSENIKTYRGLARALASHPPYQISIQKIKVMHLHCEVPDDEIYYSLNGTIVGLAVASKNSPQTFPKPVCVGLGIVRGIDVFKGLFYIITPVAITTLQNVNMFLQGFIELPSSVLQTRGLICPYISTNSISREGTGAASIKGGKQRDRKTERMAAPQ